MPKELELGRWYFFFALYPILGSFTNRPILCSFTWYLYFLVFYYEYKKTNHENPGCCGLPPRFRMSNFFWKSLLQKNTWLYTGNTWKTSFLLKAINLCAVWYGWDQSWPCISPVSWVEMYQNMMDVEAPPTSVSPTSVSPLMNWARNSYI